CPRYLRAGNKGVTWVQFKDKLDGNTSSSTSTSKPAKNKPNMTTDSIVVYLDSLGQNSTYAHRKKLAQQHGIKNYKGTASQNTKLLKLLRQGGSTSSKTNTKK